MAAGEVRDLHTFPCPHGPVAAATSDRMTIRPEILQRPASCAPRAHHFCHRLRLRPKQWSDPPQDARPWPIACWKLGIGAPTNRLPRVRHAQSSPAPVREPPQPPPTRIGAEALNATDDEKTRELVIALMGQEPGDEPRRPRTPLLAPFITHDVLLRVNNSLTPLNNAERGGWGLQAALGRAVAALTGAPRAAFM